MTEKITNMRPLYIFDLDGTLALIEHRLHFIQRPSLKCYDCGGANRYNCVQCSDLDAGFKANWCGFFAACKDDQPNAPVIQTMQALRAAGAEIWIWSGRSDECQVDTKDWLAKHCGAKFGGWLTPEAFRMRKAGDYRDDVVVKSEWLSELEPPERKRLTAVFDDRARVVQMWRDAGVTCFQVAAGEF
jgi:hypothetical protein